MRKLDLTQKPSANDDLAGAAYARSEPPVLVETSTLTPRVLGLRLHARNPSTGVVDIVTVESTAPNAAMRQRMTTEAARLAGGHQWGQLPYSDAVYLTALARVLVQCSELPVEHRWILDDVGATLALQEALVEHDRRYFLGVDGSGSVRAGVSRVECPWSDAGDATGASGSAR